MATFISKSMWLFSLHLIGLILQFEYNLFVIGHPTNGSLLSAMQHNTESGVSQRQLAASTYYFIFIKLLSQALGLSTRPNRHIFWPLWKADVCTAIHSIYTLLVCLNFQIYSYPKLDSTSLLVNFCINFIHNLVKKKSNFSVQKYSMKHSQIKRCCNNEGISINFFVQAHLL